ncbi:MAG: hypothetical protein GXP28_05790 [Planctomycetes bacterium]|nr:hypothetical protein [Planctomycetota bacterium]
MSTKHNLPPELAGFEARLRAEPLAASGVDRDGLMYQAGWAAAEASRKSGWLWPTTSVVLAASVVVLAALLLSSSSEMSSVARVEVETKPVAVPVVVVEPKEPVINTWRQPKLRWTSRSPFLVMRERALRMEFDEPDSMAWADGDYVPKAVTARELMQEIL